jgi:putative ABC transport system permease protein
MSRLTLRSLAARPLRTALTTLAIVLGVALVTGALTLTDTQRRASGALSSAAYDGTDAVVSARTAFSVDSDQDWAVTKPAVDAAVVDRVRAVPEVALAVGDVTDQNARITGPSGEPIGQGPYFGVGLDARSADVERVTPFRLTEGRWATGPGQVVVDAKTAEDEDLRPGAQVRVSTRGAAQPFTVVGIARFGDVKSLGPATAAVFDLRAAQDLFAKGDGVDSVLVAGREGVPAERVRAAVAAAVGDAGRVQSAAAHDRFAFDGLDQFISIIRTVLLVFGGIAVLVGALTIVNSLSMTVAQRTRELALLRLVGAGRGQVLRAVLAEAAAIGLLGSLAGLAAGYGIAQGLQGLFASLGLDLPQAGTVFATGTVVTGLLVGTLVTLAAGLVPALRATRVAPVVALRESGAEQARAGIRRATRAPGRLAPRPPGRAARRRGRRPRPPQRPAPARPHGVDRRRADHRRRPGHARRGRRGRPALDDRGRPGAPRRRHARRAGRRRLVADRPGAGRRARADAGRAGRHDGPAGRRPRARRRRARQRGRRRPARVRPRGGRRGGRDARPRRGDRRRGLGGRAGARRRRPLRGPRRRRRDPRAHRPRHRDVAGPRRARPRADHRRRRPRSTGRSAPSARS